jgi:hypothetical protein
VGDLLALLDQAIEGLTRADSSRCSRSGINEQPPTGTLKSLKSDTVPVVPVVPGQNGQTYENAAHSDEMCCLNSLPQERESSKSTLQKTPGTTGTTGTALRNQRLIVPKTISENGNNGNNSTQSHVVFLDAYMRAALQRPVSWADPAARPSPGAFCSCCKGNRWWGNAQGWRCWRCHPPDGLPTGSVTEVRT